MLGKLLGKKEAGKGDLDSLKQRFNSIQQPAQQASPPPAQQPFQQASPPPQQPFQQASPPPQQPFQQASPPPQQPFQQASPQSPSLQKPIPPQQPVQQAVAPPVRPPAQGISPVSPTQDQPVQPAQPAHQAPQQVPSAPAQQAPHSQESQDQQHFEVVEVIGSGNNYESVSLDSQAPAEIAPVSGQPMPQEGDEKMGVKKISRYLDDLKNQLDDTKLTSLIIQQVKELIEIDQNLNNKIKDLEDSLKKETKEREKLKDIIEKHHEEFKKSEKNMDKFIALYEVVTNQFNPFVEKGMHQGISPNPPRVTMSIPEIPGSRQVPKKDGPQETKPASSVPHQKLDIPVTPPPAEPDVLGSVISSIGQVPEPQSAPAVQSESSLKNLPSSGGADMRVGAETLEPHTPSPPVSPSPQPSYSPPPVSPSPQPSYSPPPVSPSSQPSYSPPVSPAPQPSYPPPQPANPSVRGVPQGQPPKQPPQDIPPELHFETKDGQSIRSLGELVTLLKGMSSDVFDHHVTKTGNDFAAWVHHVVKNEDLAQELGPIKNRLDMIHAIMKHI